MWEDSFLNNVNQSSAGSKQRSNSSSENYSNMMNVLDEGRIHTGSLSFSCSDH